MQKHFTLENLVTNTLLYSAKKVNDIYAISNNHVNIKDILQDSWYSLNYKGWYLSNCCHLTNDEHLQLAVVLGKSVSRIFNENCPNDTRLNECWQAIDDFGNNLITKEQLLEKQDILRELTDTYNFHYSSIRAAHYTISAFIYGTTDTTDHAYAVECALSAARHQDVKCPNSYSYSELLNQKMIEFVDNC